MAALITSCEQGPAQSATETQPAVLNGKRQRTEVEEVAAAAAHNGRTRQDSQHGVSTVLDGPAADEASVPAAAADETGCKADKASPAATADNAAKEVCTGGSCAGDCTEYFKDFDGNGHEHM